MHHRQFKLVINKIVKFFQKKSYLPYTGETSHWKRSDSKYFKPIGLPPPPPGEEDIPNVPSALELCFFPRFLPIFKSVCCAIKCND